MKQYAIYLRKSRADAEAEARGEGETLARHEKILTDLAKRQKLNVKAVYREIVSGETISARPVMQQLLSEVEQGLWTGVLVVEVERLARGDTIDQGIVSQAFKYSGTKIITPMKTYDPSNEFDEEYFEFGLFMSRREYKVINRRLQRGRLQATKEGRYLGSIPPYGYDKTTIDHVCTLKPNEPEAKVVQMIFQMFVYGLNGRPTGTTAICNELNRLHIPTRTGANWVASTIIPLLRNPVYIGKVKWNFRKVVKTVENGVVKQSRPRADLEDMILADGLHPAIIDIDLFNKAQDKMKANKSNHSPSWNAIKNPLASICHCAKCGRTMVRRPYQHREDMLICTNTHCNNIGSDLNLVYDGVKQELRKFLNEYETEWKNLSPQNTNDDQMYQEQISEAKKQKDTLQKQLNKQYDLLEQGLYSFDVFTERSALIKKQLEEIEIHIQDIQKKITEIEDQKKLAFETIPKFRDALVLLDSVNDPLEQNKILKKLVKSCLYQKDNRSGKQGNKGEFTLYVTPKI
ncbi:recombinase family protein [Massiliimalia timonensis]|uniref:recombinase family protein n=1 Tax=Massiliimalia timonensis TaxID=1987501 RepID=UPI00189D3553|nr:recombinase family protein [Massiliimalia timonensis]